MYIFDLINVDGGRWNIVDNTSSRFNLVTFHHITLRESIFIFRTMKASSEEYRECSSHTYKSIHTVCILLNCAKYIYRDCPSVLLRNVTNSSFLKNHKFQRNIWSIILESNYFCAPIKIIWTNVNDGCRWDIVDNTLVGIHKNLKREISKNIIYKNH